jgi:ABC-type transport system involved in multi-copper enzyme maturation permease subunit
MNRHLALRYLCWKETRQVLPLVWMQLVLGIGFQLLFALQHNKTFTPHLLLFAGMPSLFALGVGSLLVGQEKERRTLDWLRSLPVAAGDVLRVKLAVGFVALVAVWALTLLLLALFVLPRHPWHVAMRSHAGQFDPGWEFLFPLQSVFFLLAGFATAWTFRSSLVGLLAVIPVALLPVAISFGLNDLYRRFGSGDSIRLDPSPWLWAATFVALSLLLLVIGWRRGMKSLAAEQFREKPRFWSLAPFNPWNDTPLWTRPPHAPTAMLIWQFLRQNRTVLLGIVAMLLSALVLLGASPLNSGGPALAMFLMLLATSWLGVLAFHGDGLHERIRFLAERGVSPAQTWVTRHAVPLSLLAVAMFAGAFVLPSPFPSRALLDARTSSPLILSMFCLVLSIYAISQAVGQIFRSATIAALTAPVAAWMLVGYGVLLVTWLGAPFWLIGIFALIPWLATFVLMRRWMDGRLGLSYWVAHGGFLAMGSVLPLVPLGLVMISQPTMPAEVRRQLMDEARRYGTGWPEPRELVLKFREPEPAEFGAMGAGAGMGGGMIPDSGPADLPPPLSRQLEGRIVREQLEHDLSRDPGPVSFTPRVMAYLLGEASLARMALEQDGAGASQQERYRRTLALIETMVRRMRLSWRMIEQDGADLIEIWLVHELARPQAKTWLDSEVYGRLVRALSDEAGRHAARRRAVVMSWAAYRAQFRSDAPETMLGGYSRQGSSFLVLINPYTRRRAADYLTWQMLQWLEEGKQSESVERRRELARYWGLPELYYGLGPGAEFLRADDPANFGMPVEGFFRRAPGSQWHAGWEYRARELTDGLEH